MAKVFVFCIGGTGIRVMKSITMLMAGGMSTNGYTVIPVILDPHLDLEDLTLRKRRIFMPLLKVMRISIRDL